MIFTLNCALGEYVPMVILVLSVYLCRDRDGVLDIQE